MTAIAHPLVLALMLVGLVGCRREPPEDAEGATAAAVDDEVELPGIGRPFRATYTGTLPCADCEGIETRLTLLEDCSARLDETPPPEPAACQTFRLVETYLGAEGDNRFVEQGVWFVLRGDAENPDATVYRIVPADSAAERSFRLRPGGALELLDSQQRPIRSERNYTLTRQRPSNGS